MFPIMAGCYTSNFRSLPEQSRKLKDPEGRDHHQPSVSRQLWRQAEGFRIELAKSDGGLGTRQFDTGKAVRVALYFVGIESRSATPLDHAASSTLRRKSCTTVSQLKRFAVILPCLRKSREVSGRAANSRT
jgi:hypothetical protein